MKARMTKEELLIAGIFIALALVVLMTNKLARAILRETITHPFRRARLIVRLDSVQVEIDA